jgi:hypothetical protein
MELSRLDTDPFADFFAVIPFDMSASSAERSAVPAHE